MSPIPGIYSPAQGIAVPLVVPLNLAIQTSNTGTTAGQNTLPAGINAGDLIVIFDTASNNTGGAAAVTPTGFTNILNVTAGNNRCMCHYKIAAGTESSVNVGGMNGGISNNRMNWVFRGVRPIQTVLILAVLTQITDNDPSSQVVTSSSGVAPIIVFAGYRSTGSVTPRTFSPAPDAELNSSLNAFLASKVFNSSPVDVTVDMGDNGNDNGLVSFYLQITG